MKKKFSKILGVGLTLALLASLLLTAAPVSALSVPSVTVAPTTISKTATYTVTTTIDEDLEDTDEIIVEFDAGIDISGTLSVTIAATAGFGTDPITPPIAAGIVVDGQVLTITIPTAIPEIGRIARVTVVVSGITNPDVAGDYSLAISTTYEDAKTSAAFAITDPEIAPLPGVVELRNSAGILMGNWTDKDAIQDAINDAGADYVINVGEGTYEADLTILDTLTNLELVGAEGAVIKGSNTAVGSAALRIKASGVKVHGFTIESAAGAISGGGINTIYGIDVLNEDVEIYDNDFVAVAETVGEIVASVDPTVTMIATVSVGSGAPEVDNDITGLSIHDNTFTSDTVASVWSEAIYVNYNATAGVQNLGGDITIADNEFGGNILRAIITERSNTTISGNTIVSAWALDGTFPAQALHGITVRNYGITQDAVVVTGNSVTAFEAGIVLGADVALTDISVTDNTLEGNDTGVLVRSSADGISVNFNDIIDSVTLGVENTDDEGTVDATFNWWGTDVAADVIAMVSAGVTCIPFLAGIADTVLSDSKVGTGTFLNASTTVGVAVSGIELDDKAEVITVAKYIDNPQEALADAIAFYDVYVAGADPDDKVTIKFYAGDEYTKVYIWSADTDIWVPVVIGGFSAYGGYVWVEVEAAFLDRTPFALVAAVEAATLDAPEELFSPVIGEEDVELRPIFSWSAVGVGPITAWDTSIEGREAYAFELDDNPYFATPLVALHGDERLTVPFYAQRIKLDYSTGYYWRVKAVRGVSYPETWDVTEISYDVQSAWTGGVFYTMAEPEPEEAEVWMCSEGLTFDTRKALEAHLATAEAHQPVEPPEIIIESPDVIVPLPAETPIAPTWIYVIIAVGAVLVTSVIVLIVRTRRVA